MLSRSLNYLVSASLPLARCRQPVALVVATLLILANGMRTARAEEKPAVLPPVNQPPQIAKPDLGAASAASTPRGPVAVLTIRGELTDITVESLRRRVDEAKAGGVNTIVFELDTPGGLVTSSIAIADLIRELDSIHTVAWVNPNAHSGGALVALACDEIIMTRSSRIGDSQVIMGGPTGAMPIPKELQPKAYTPVLADFRQSARLNGYDQTLCESFVVPDREVWWVENIKTGERKFVLREEKLALVGEEPKPAKTTPGTDPSPENAGDTPALPTALAEHEWRLVTRYHDAVLGQEADVIQPVVKADQLLEMHPSEAMAFGFCKAIVSSESELRARYGAIPLLRLAPNWSEELAFWLTSMYVRGFLLLVIFLSAYVEFHTAGTGLPGLVALIALAIFVGAPYLTGLANVWEIILIILGIGLIALEILVIPGFGVAGIAGLIVLLIGLLATFLPDEPGRTFPFSFPNMPGTMAFLQSGLQTIVAAMATSLIGMVILGRYLPKSPLFHHLVPPNPTAAETRVEDPYLGLARPGDLGEAVGSLRPAGKARLSGALVDVVTQGEFLDAGARVEVVERRGNVVVVRRAT